MREFFGSHTSLHVDVVYSANCVPCTALGATGEEHPSVLGMMGAGEIAGEISLLKSEGKDPNIIQKGHRWRSW